MLTRSTVCHGNLSQLTVIGRIIIANGRSYGSKVSACNPKEVNSEVVALSETLDVENKMWHGHSCQEVIVQGFTVYQ